MFIFKVCTGMFVTIAMLITTIMMAGCFDDNTVSSPTNIESNKILLYTTRSSGSGNGSRAYCYDEDLPGALAEEGFSVVARDRASIPTLKTSILETYCQLWIVSTESNPTLSANEVQAIHDFHDSGKGILIIADSDSYDAPAAQISSTWGVSFEGEVNHCGGSIGCPVSTDNFTSHEIWNGVSYIEANLNEGNLVVTPPSRAIATHNGATMVAVNEAGAGRVAWDATWYRFTDASSHPNLAITHHDNMLYARNLAKWLSQAPTCPCQPDEIYFAGYCWNVKTGDNKGPGPCNWSADNVTVDPQTGDLHLKITNRNDKWYCAEVYTNERLGFGRYQWQVIGRIDNLDQNVVLGMFNYPTPDVGPDKTNEIDIEMAQWGDDENMMGNFSVWPTTLSLLKESRYYDVSLNGDYTTHRFMWQSNEVFFQSLHGHRDDDLYEIASWRFEPDDYLDRICQDPMPVHINLWLFEGQPPSDNEEVELVIKSFTFTP